MNATPSDHLTLLQKGSLVEVAPGMYRPTNPADVPEIVLARLAATGNGAYRLVPAGEAWVRLCTEVVSALGFCGSWDTILRLSAAGFVETVKIAPGTTLLNMQSWWGHLRRCSEDPWFWEEPKRRECYLDAVRTIGRSERKRKPRRHQKTVIR